MLYQLSYLGIPRGSQGANGPAGYSGLRRRCLSIQAGGNDGFSTPLGRSGAPIDRNRLNHGSPVSARQFSTLICASWITGPHLAVSDCRKAASSELVEPFGTAPSSSKRDNFGSIAIELWVIARAEGPL